jgi:hypothetical protein
VEGCGDYGNEYSYVMKDGEFLEYPSHNHFFSGMTLQPRVNLLKQLLINIRVISRKKGFKILEDMHNNVTLWRVCVTIVVMKIQSAFRILLSYISLSTIYGYFVLHRNDFMADLCRQQRKENLLGSSCKVPDIFVRL